MKTLQQLFKRYRRPGDLFFAMCFLLLAAFLLSQISTQTDWKPNTKVSNQPALWSIISIVGMVVFGFLNAVSGWVSPRIDGRLQEIGFWLRSLEYVAWFMIYVTIVPLLGYLPTTIVFAIFLAVRAGYRRSKMIGFSVLTAVSIVVIFKSFLQVKVPGGQVYEFLPTAMRSFMLTYF